MHDAVPMRLVERIGQLNRRPQRFIDRHRTALQSLRKGLPFEELHHEVIDTVVPPDVEDRTDVRMAERRERLGLALESNSQLLLFGDLLNEDLDRDNTIETRVARSIHLTHAAAPDQRQDFVRPEVCAGGQRHGSCVPANHTLIGVSAVAVQAGTGSDRRLRQTAHVMSEGQ